jgi:hypothetical protein
MGPKYACEPAQLAAQPINLKPFWPSSLMDKAQAAINMIV